MRVLDSPSTGTVTGTRQALYRHWTGTMRAPTDMISHRRRSHRDPLLLQLHLCEYLLSLVQARLRFVAHCCSCLGGLCMCFRHTLRIVPCQPAHHNKRLSEAAAGEGQALAREMRSIKKTGYFVTRSEWALSCAAICQPSCAGLLARRGADPLWNRGPAPASPSPAPRASSRGRHARAPLPAQRKRTVVARSHKLASTTLPPRLVESRPTAVPRFPRELS